MRSNRDGVREGQLPGGLPYLAVGTGPPLLFLGGSAARRIRVANPVDAVTMLRAEDEFDVWARLPQIPTETLVAYGAHDYFWPLGMVAETADRMPRARLILYADRGHALPLAKEFVRDVMAFLGVPSPRSLNAWRCSSR